MILILHWFSSTIYIYPTTQWAMVFISTFNCNYHCNKFKKSNFKSSRNLVTLVRNSVHLLKFLISNSIIHLKLKRTALHFFFKGKYPFTGELYHWQDDGILITIARWHPSPTPIQKRFPAQTAE
jgi:hypothetical protein